MVFVDHLVSVNPASCDAEAGFYDGASRRVIDMLIGRDVSVPVPIEDERPIVRERVAASPGHLRARVGSVVTRAR